MTRGRCRTPCSVIATLPWNVENDAATQGCGGVRGCFGSRRWPSTTAVARSMSLRLSMRERSRNSANALSPSMAWRSIRMPLAHEGAASKCAFEVVVLGEAAQDDIDRALPVLDVGVA